MRCKKGITIVEVLVVLIIAGIMLIGVSALSNIGNRSNQKIAGEASVYDDISYAFKLMQSRVHKSFIQTNGTELITGSEKFNTYTHAGGRDLVYYPNRFDESVNQVIFSVPSAGSLNLAYTINAAAGHISISLAGEKNDVPFDMSTTVQSRRY